MVGKAGAKKTSVQDQYKMYKARMAKAGKPDSEPKPGTKLYSSLISAGILKAPGRPPRPVKIRVPGPALPPRPTTTVPRYIVPIYTAKKVKIPKKDLGPKEMSYEQIVRLRERRKRIENAIKKQQDLMFKIEAMKNYKADIIKNKILDLNNKLKNVELEENRVYVPRTEDDKKRAKRAREYSKSNSIF